MKHALIFKHPAAASIIGIFPTKADAEHALSWQIRGGFRSVDYAIAVPAKQIGTFKDIASEEIFSPGRGAYTEKAWKQIHLELWGVPL